MPRSPALAPTSSDTRSSSWRELPSALPLSIRIRPPLLGEVARPTSRRRVFVLPLSLPRRVNIQCTGTLASFPQSSHWQPSSLTRIPTHLNWFTSAMTSSFDSAYFLASFIACRPDIVAWARYVDEA